MAERPIRVAIVGGGCAALSAAFELTRAEHGGKYAVTVYQMGWRLGGKGASGRGAADRIEEHGLHLWMGFYENAFRLMRECYAELGRDPLGCRIADWRDAFSPAPVVGVAERMPRAEGWLPWIAHFPAAAGLPGDPLAERNPFSVSGYLQQSAVLVFELIRSASERLAARAEETRAAGAPGVPSAQSVKMRRGPEEIVDAIDRVLKYGQLATAAALLEAASLLRSAMDALVPNQLHDGWRQSVVVRLIDAIAAAARRQLEMLVSADAELRRVWHVIDLILAILRGSFRFGLALDPRGFDAIDDYDWRAWLRENGASEEALDSGFLRGIYDLAFAFPGGDVARPSLAAGVALRGAMRMFFTYRGSLFWKMHAGMGDIVFAPLYEVLKKRGVKFAFFHRLQNVKLAPAESLAPGEMPLVEALEFDVQATVKDGAAYRPLVDVRGLPCWPSHADPSQLQDGERIAAEGWELESPWETRKAGETTVHVGRDFDYVVLGLSIGALPLACRELAERDGRWRAMVEHTGTVATQSAQLWMRAGDEELGWKAPPVNLTGYVEPFDTWADMRHLIPEESWKLPPKSIAYLCSALPDPWPQSEAGVVAARARVLENTRTFLDRDAAALWPGAVDKAGFRLALLATDSDGQPETSQGAMTGEARLAAQYFSANVRPSDRYVLSLPGTLKYRLSPLDLICDNMTIAGDWTDSGLNTGCIESAVISGRLAAHALSQSPPLEDIIGYDHP